MSLEMAKLPRMAQGLLLRKGKAEENLRMETETHESENQ